MTDIKSMTQEEITDALRAMGEPAFRGKQVFSWLHKGATDFAEMNNLSKPLREKLGKKFTITAPTVARKQVSRLDGTVKYLWELRDGNCIETVLMSYHHGNTVCISSQVGCRMGCKFCASTIAGKVRDLTPSEMLDQVLFTQLDSGKDISNIVLMGIGEPLDNRANVLRFLAACEPPGGAEHRNAPHLAFHLRRCTRHRRACGGKPAAHSFRFAPRAGQRDAQPHHAGQQRLRRGEAVRRLPPLF